jgi:hypothetical protein
MLVDARCGVVLDSADTVSKLTWVPLFGRQQEPISDKLSYLEYLNQG